MRWRLAAGALTAITAIPVGIIACVEPPQSRPSAFTAKPIACWYGDDCALPLDAGAPEAASSTARRDASFDLLAIPIREHHFKCPPRQDADLPTPRGTVADARRRLLEGSSFGCLDGTVVGLLTTPRGRTGETPAPYALRLDDDAPRAAFIGLHKGETRASTNAVTVPVAANRPTQLTSQASLLLPGDSNAWHLSKETHLVRVEVNDGHGSPAGASSLIATDVMLLDGSGEFPIDVDATIREFVAPFFDESRPATAAIRARIANAMANVIGNNPLPGAIPKRSDTTSTIAVTWHRDTEQLEILYYLKRVDRVERRKTPSVVGSREYTVEYAALALRDKRGGVLPTPPIPIESHAAQVNEDGGP
jgi:hypothetical protein